MKKHHAKERIEKRAYLLKLKLLLPALTARTAPLTPTHHRSATSIHLSCVAISLSPCDSSKSLGGQLLLLCTGSYYNGILCQQLVLPVALRVMSVLMSSFCADQCWFFCLLLLVHLWLCVKISRSCTAIFGKWEALSSLHPPSLSLSLVLFHSFSRVV